MSKPARTVSRCNDDDGQPASDVRLSAMESRLLSTGSSKGRSGNPCGRPKGRRTRCQKDRVSTSPQPANQMLLEEAYRTMTIREGEKIIELPVIKAVFRSMGVSAMKGNRLAQATDGGAGPRYRGGGPSAS